MYEMPNSKYVPNYNYRELSWAPFIWTNDTVPLSTTDLRICRIILATSIFSSDTLPIQFRLYSIQFRLPLAVPPL